MEINKEKSWLVLIFIMSVVLTAFSIYWNYRFSINHDKESTLINFPHIKISIILTIITFLFGRIFYLENLLDITDDKKTISNSAINYYFIVIIISLILYPGTKILKISSDDNAFCILFTIGIVQALTLHSIISLAQEKNNFLINIVILLVVSLILIFSGQYVFEFLSNGYGRSTDYLDY